MSSSEINVLVCHRPDRSVSIDQRHTEVMRRMVQIGSPLGFSGLELPPAPDCGGNLSAHYRVKFTIRGLSCRGDYLYRGDQYEYEDKASYDERLHYTFKVSNKLIDYREILRSNLPQVIEAFGAYRAFVSCGSYDLDYIMGGDHGVDENGYAISTNDVYKSLAEDKSININGRNNIYTLRSAQFWDAGLCRRALGYGPDEVVNRLEGHALHAEHLMDGVYIVLSDDIALSYADFVAMNERIKPLLGLV